MAARAASRCTCPCPFASHRRTETVGGALSARLSPLMQQYVAAPVLTSLHRRTLFVGWRTATATWERWQRATKQTKSRRTNRSVAEVQGTHHFRGIEQDGIKCCPARPSVSASSVAPTAHLQVLSLEDQVQCHAPVLIKHWTHWWS